MRIRATTKGKVPADDFDRAGHAGLWPQAVIYRAPMARGRVGIQRLGIDAQVDAALVPTQPRAHVMSLVRRPRHLAEPRRAEVAVLDANAAASKKGAGE